MKNRTNGLILGFFGAIALILVGIGAVSVRNIGRTIASSDWVNHTHAVIQHASGALSSLRIGDAAMLTFALTGDARDRVAGREAFADVDEHLELAKALTRNEPAQHDEVVQLEALIDKRIQFSRDLVAAGQSGRPDAVRSLLATGAGEEALADVQRATEELVNEETGLLDERDRASHVQAQTTKWTVWAGIAVNVVLLAGVAWLILDDLAARRRAAAVLEEANRTLETRVRERTAELTAANDQLQAENLERNWLNQSQEHQLRYNQLIINSISDLVFVLTKAMNISRINPAVVHLTGFEAQDLVNRPFSSVARLDDGVPGRAALIDPIARALNEGRDLRDQPATAEDRNGAKTPVRLSLYPLRDRDKVVGGVVIIRPVNPPL